MTRFILRTYCNPAKFKLLAALFSFSFYATGQTTVTQSDYAQTVAPQVQRNLNNVIDNDLWKRKALSSRDRSIVTLSGLIARGQLDAMPEIVGKALDSDVSPEEIAEVVNHLAFYTGFANAKAAIAAIGPVYAARDIKAKQLPSSELELLPLNEEQEKQRANYVGSTFGDVSPGTVQYTTDALFRDLWLRPGLAPRDRSMATVAALVATGQVEQVNFHLNKAMDNGLTREEAGEMLTQLAFYSGWPKAFSALLVFKEIFEKRNEK
ncbi:MAG: 4-carboxymuconolactone decarboxylase [Alteromonadaceae bacterium]|nr:4-carboxymuconolactone decarboxylase [Alteromonadaceae bacterium]MBT82719.1 4-carboxymuconolactone decarboxylase [Alteromonadaceae bacterium]